MEGVPHWVRVRGLELASVNGARAAVVELFVFVYHSKYGMS
jgi:hypothetical protein